MGFEQIAFIIMLIMDVEAHVYMVIKSNAIRHKCRDQQLKKGRHSRSVYVQILTIAKSICSKRDAISLSVSLTFSRSRVLHAPQYARASSGLGRKYLNELLLPHMFPVLVYREMSPLGPNLHSGTRPTYVTCS